jgi:hypothetical protein
MGLSGRLEFDSSNHGLCSMAPGSSHDQQPTDPPRHPPQMHTYVQTVQSSTCLQVQSSLLKAPTTNLTGPVATPAPPAA